MPVLRGRASRPLLVTAAGLPVDEAVALVRAMAGPHRLPDALRRVDRLCRDGAAALPAEPTAVPAGDRRRRD